MEQLTELRKLELEYCPLPLFVTKPLDEDEKGYKVLRCFFNPVLDRSDRMLILESVYNPGSYMVEQNDPKGYNYWRIVNESSGGKYEHHVPSTF